MAEAVPIIVCQYPDEATRTKEEPCQWVAEAVVGGRLFTARPRYRVVNALARELVADRHPRRAAGRRYAPGCWPAWLQCQALVPRGGAVVLRGDGDQAAAPCSVGRSTHPLRCCVQPKIGGETAGLCCRCRPRPPPRANREPSGLHPFKPQNGASSFHAARSQMNEFS
jgi:hypothetical protein